MTTPVWQPGKLYPPGSLVVPRTAPAAIDATITNPGFESDATGWTLGAATAISTADKYSGTKSIEFTGTGGETETIHDKVPVLPGVQITAGMQYQQGVASKPKNAGAVLLRWYDSTETLISDSVGNVVSSGSSGAWHPSSVTALSPPNAAYVAIGCVVVRDASNSSWADAFTWSYTQAVAPAGLVFKAVQPATGYSATTEPAWPATTGIEVIDNEVTWEGIVGTRVVYQARALLKSGPTEPTWPTDVGSSVADNTIKWKLTTRRVDDPKAPNSPYVVIDYGKVYAGDDDIVAFSATNNPLDWSTPNDAGYLPFGLNKYGSNPIRALGLYRGNLIVFNSQGCQVWQIDPDPELNSRLDALPIGSIYHQAFAPVSNDALFLSQLGVRSLGLSAASTNLQAGDVGTPIDALVKPRLDAGEFPLGLYTASGGQYWLSFNNDDDTSETFVFTLGASGSVGSWSRYLLPFRIDNYIIDSDTLVLRSLDRVIEIDRAYGADLITDALPAGVDFYPVIWTPWLECGGQLGQDKMLEGIDISGTALEPPTVQFGWDQNDTAALTDPYAIPADTVPDSIIPFELTAPSISVKLTYKGGGWSFSALNLYLQGRRLAR